jgi:predicted Zn-dependent protease with MMP-like domain
MSVDWVRLQAIAESEINAILNSLPPELAVEARRLPVTFEARPNQALRADGVDGDTLGLFVGGPFADFDSGASPLPPQIFLFLLNIQEAAENDAEQFRNEVRTTFLHELGHYLGLDETDLDERGLQ